MATLTSSNYHLTRTQAVQALMKVRHEWETVAKGDPLTEINGSVGYLLYDVAIGLGLTKSELELALGDIAQEIE